MLVLRARQSAGAGPVGFRRSGRTGQVRAQVPGPSADSGRGESARLGWLIPGAAEVSGQRPGKAELGVGSDDQLCPPVCCLGCAELRAVPAQCLFDHPEGVFQVESAQERLPVQVDVFARQDGGRLPQPDAERIVAAGQSVDLQADQHAFDEGEFAGVVAPRGADGQTRTDAVPGYRASGAVAVGDSRGCGMGGAPQVS